MTEHEEFVRKHWEYAECVQPKFIEPHANYWWVELGSTEPSTQRGYVVRHTIDAEESGEDAAWSAAYAFTVERLREIAEDEEAIRLIDHFIDQREGYSDPEYASIVFGPLITQQMKSLKRILTLLQSILAEKQKGMVKHD